MVAPCHSRQIFIGFSPSMTRMYSATVWMREAVLKLAAGPRRKLVACPEIAPILRAYRVALV